MAQGPGSGNARGGGRIVVALAVALAAVPALAAPAAAGGVRSAPTASISLGDLVLDPGERGYQGALPVTVTNTGTTASDFGVLVHEPVGGSFEGTDPMWACGYQTPVDNRRVVSCGVPGGPLDPGEQRSFTVTFHALTTPRPYAMTFEGGSAAVQSSDGVLELDRASFLTRFRSTSGSLTDPQPYVQDQLTDASIVAADDVTLTRQPDGTYTGWIPVTVRYGGDARHDGLWAEASLPGGVVVVRAEPELGIGTFTSFAAGEDFMPGEERDIDVLLRAPAEAVPGVIGTGAFTLGTVFGFDEVPDVDPSDNTVTFGITAVE